MLNIATPGFNKLTPKNYAARLNEVNLESKTDLDI